MTDQLAWIALKWKKGKMQRIKLFYHEVTMRWLWLRSKNVQKIPCSEIGLTAAADQKESA
ncbi:hypothetical protein ACMGGS_10265 [Superficieibacter sp. BNK-5]|uniref:hypothetical protein n=1 Tax=Superficieibacter sp. BNK-5 TaxID=3376142 RepID=UPI0039BF9D68